LRSTVAAPEHRRARSPSLGGGAAIRGSLPVEGCAERSAPPPSAGADTEAENPANDGTPPLRTRCRKGLLRARPWRLSLVASTNGTPDPASRLRVRKLQRAGPTREVLCGGCTAPAGTARLGPAGAGLRTRPPATAPPIHTPTPRVAPSVTGSGTTTPHLGIYVKDYFQDPGIHLAPCGRGRHGRAADGRVRGHGLSPIYTPAGPPRPLTRSAAPTRPLPQGARRGSEFVASLRRG